MKTLTSILIISLMISLIVVTAIFAILDNNVSHELKVQITSIVIMSIMASVFIGYLFFYIEKMSEPSNSIEKQSNDELKSDIDFLEYDICGSWWSGFISSEFLSNLVAKYFLAKHKRKLRRYRFFKQLGLKI